MFRNTKGWVTRAGAGAHPATGVGGTAVAVASVEVTEVATRAVAASGAQAQGQAVVGAAGKNGAPLDAGMGRRASAL